MAKRRYALSSPSHPPAWRISVVLVYEAQIPVPPNLYPDCVNSCSREGIWIGAGYELNELGGMGRKARDKNWI
jgi:hypothetical protein